MSENSTQEQTAPAVPGLSVQDLLLVVQTLQVVTARGAVKAGEMETVGGLYNRLVAFLRASGAIKDADETAEETSVTNPAEETTGE